MSKKLKFVVAPGVSSYNMGYMGGMFGGSSPVPNAFPFWEESDDLYAFEPEVISPLDFWD